LKERKDEPLSDFNVIVITRCWNWEKEEAAAEVAQTKTVAEV
jgi:hypothetical protein